MDDGYGAAPHFSLKIHLSKMEKNGYGRVPPFSETETEVMWDLVSLMA